MNKHVFAFFLPVAVGLAFVLVASPARASSLIVNVNNPASLYTASPLEDAAPGNVHTNTEHGSMTIRPAVQTEYRYSFDIIDQAGNDLGPLSCGSTITTKQKIRATVVQPVSSDVQWFNPGGAWDTPYGDVVAGGAQPGTVCTSKNALYYITGNAYYQTYATFSLNPPATSITADSVDVLSCSGSETSSTRTCTPVKEGRGQVDISFAPTYGYFYGGIRYDSDSHNDDVDTSACYWNKAMIGVNGYDYINWNHANNGTFYTQEPTQIPAGAAHCAVTIIPASGNPPTAPKLSAGSTVACRIGSPYTIQMTATDPDGDDIRYGIDWNNDGIVDQYVPGTGHVPSGTTLSAWRSFATAGSKTVRVLTQDKTGLTSPWSTLTVSCQAATDIIIIGDSSDDNTDNLPTITNGDGGPLDATLRAIPSLVKKGATSHVFWGSNNARSCSVKGSNGDGGAVWDTLLSPIDGIPTAPIHKQVDYTLICTGADGSNVTRKASVYVVPSWQEF